jgi:hypothetical protein
MSIKLLFPCVYSKCKVSPSAIGSYSFTINGYEAYNLRGIESKKVSNDNVNGTDCIIFIILSLIFELNFYLLVIAIRNWLDPSFPIENRRPVNYYRLVQYLCVVHF